MTTLGLQYLQHQEAVRSNLRNEELRQAQNDETIRSNLVNEGIKQGSLDEQVRSNKANEWLKTLANAIQEAQAIEQARSNVTREMETNRHNLATEEQAYKELYEKSREFDATYQQKEYWSNIQARLDLLRSMISHSGNLMSTQTKRGELFTKILSSLSK